jgi:lysophospholipase L1-like esterase
VATGNWISSTSNPGYLGPDYWHDNNEAQGTKSVFYNFPSSNAGLKRVYLRWVENANRASTARITVTHRDGSAVLSINQRTNGGSWRLLGIWNFTGVAGEGLQISNQGANGYVIADGVGLEGATVNDDSDEDGVTDLREIALGTDPTISNAALFTSLRKNAAWLNLASTEEIYDITLKDLSFLSTPTARSLTYRLADGAAWQNNLSLTLDPTPQRRFYRGSLVSNSAAFMTRLQANQPQKIVVYGTSLTANGSWVGSMTTWLQTKFPGLVTTVNSGLSGKSSYEGVLQLQTKVINQAPDVVFIEFAINDAFRYTDGTPQLTPAQARSNLLSMIDSIKLARPNCEIILQTMNPAWDSPTGSNASSSLRPDLASFYANYRSVAAARGLLLIDHFPNWQNLQQSNVSTFQTAIPDGVHPTTAAWDAYVMPLLKWKLSGGPP